jgi:cation transport ATPase
MSKHEQTPEQEARDEPTHDELEKKAYALYVKGGRPQGQADQNWSDAETQLRHAGADQADHPEHKDEHKGHPNHHAHMAADFRKRFWISLALTLPILALSPLLQSVVGLREAVRFSGDLYVLFGFSSAVFWYGGWPFLKGLYTELTTSFRTRR